MSSFTRIPLRGLDRPTLSHLITQAFLSWILNPIPRPTPPLPPGIAVRGLREPQPSQDLSGPDTGSCSGGLRGRGGGGGMPHTLVTQRDGVQAQRSSPGRDDSRHVRMLTVWRLLKDGKSRGASVFRSYWCHITPLLSIPHFSYYSAALSLLS